MVGGELMAHALPSALHAKEMADVPLPKRLPFSGKSAVVGMGEGVNMQFWRNKLGGEALFLSWIGC